MGTIIWGLAAVLMTFVVWNFVVRPRLTTFRSSGYKFQVKDGVLRVQISGRGDDNAFLGRVACLLMNSENGRDIHTRHQCAMDYHRTEYTLAGNTIFENTTTTHVGAHEIKTQGERFATLTLTELRQEDLTAQFCAQTDNVSLVRGVVLNAARVKPNTISMRLSRLGAMVAKMWLRQQGAVKNVDLTPFKAVFDQRVREAQEKYRARFGFKGTDFDNIGVAYNLAPMSYALLTHHMDLRAHLVENGHTLQNSVSKLSYYGEQFSDGRSPILGVAGVMTIIPVSETMRKMIELGLKGCGAPAIEYRKK